MSLAVETSFYKTATMLQIWKWVKHLVCMGVPRNADKKLKNLKERTLERQRYK
jgi:hypothetical protein